MKSFTVREAQTRLGELVADACRGELIVLTEGDKQVTLEPRGMVDPEKDGPDLEAELLKAVNGPHQPFSEGDLRKLAQKALAARRTGHEQ